MCDPIRRGASPGLPGRPLLRLTVATRCALAALIAWSPLVQARHAKQVEVDFAGLSTEGGDLLLEGRVRRATLWPEPTANEAWPVTLGRNLASLFPWRNIAGAEVTVSVLDRAYHMRTDESGAFELRLEPPHIPKGLHSSSNVHPGIYRAGTHIGVSVSDPFNGGPPTRVRGKLLVLPRRSSFDPGGFCVVDGDGTCWEAPQATLLEQLAWPIRAALTNAYHMRPVRGVRSTLHALTSQGWPIFLVSGSPTGFRQKISEALTHKGFPESHMQLFLKPYRLSKLVRQPAELLRLCWPNVFRHRLKHLTDPADFKVARISTLLSLLPHRNALLVGDRDASPYAEIAKRFPERIVAVALRQVPGRSGGCAQTTHMSKLIGSTEQSHAQPSTPLRHPPPDGTGLRPMVFHSYRHLTEQLRHAGILYPDRFNSSKVCTAK